MTKKILSTSLFTVCLASTVLYSGYSLASSEDVYFYPKHKWVVEEVASNADEGLKTCSLSNKLNNGYVVQIVGNANGFENFNIDFRQDAFKVGGEYAVNYSVPGILERAIPTKAFKESLLVSDLRNESAFSNSLESASVLDVEIGSTKFRMYLTGLGAAIGGYNDCVNPPKILDLKNPHIDLFASTENAVNDTALNEGSPVQLQSADIAPPPPQIEMQESDSNQASVNIDGAPQNITLAPTNDLRPTASIKPRYTEHLAQQLKAESENYKPEIIENTIAEDITQIDEVVEFEESALNIDAANSIIEEKVALENIEWEDAVPAEPEKPEMQSFEVASAVPMDNMANMMATIEPIAGTSDGDFETRRDKVAELESQIDVLLNKNKMLDEELKSILKDAEDERLSVSSSDWDLERATMKFNEAERQIMRLGRKLQTQKAQCQYEKTELENMLFDPKLTNQNQLTNLALLEEEVESVKSDLYRQQRQYEERIRLLEKQLEAQ